MIKKILRKISGTKLSYFENMLISTKKDYFLSDLIFKDKKGVALDFGLNVGAFTLNNFKKFSRIVAVEASSDCLNDAKKNLKIVPVGKIDFIHAALSDKSNEKVSLKKVIVNGQFESKDFSILNMSNSDLEKTDYKGRFGDEIELVNTLSWTDLMNKLDNTPIRLLKCDIEGAEYQLFINSNLSNVEYLIFELHYTFLGKDKVGHLLNHLLKYFNFYFDKDQSLIETNSWPPPSILYLVNKNIDRDTPFWVRILRSPVFNTRRFLIDFFS
jgi:FkbM family methyltransferase